MILKQADFYGFTPKRLIELFQVYRVNYYMSRNAFTSNVDNDWNLARGLYVIDSTNQTIMTTMSAVNLIEFKCTKKPHESVLSGFNIGKVYKGRYFNGLYQISEEWASSKPTVMIEGRDFEKYFELLKSREPQHYVLSA